MCKFK